MPQMRRKDDSGLTLEVDSALLAGFVGEVGGTNPLIGKPSGIGGVEERPVVDLVGILMPVTVLTHRLTVGIDLSHGQLIETSTSREFSKNNATHATLEMATLEIRVMRILAWDEISFTTQWLNLEE